MMEKQVLKVRPRPCFETRGVMEMPSCKNRLITCIPPWPKIIFDETRKLVKLCTLTLNLIFVVHM